MPLRFSRVMMQNVRITLVPERIRRAQVRPSYPYSVAFFVFFFGFSGVFIDVFYPRNFATPASDIGINAAFMAVGIALAAGVWLRRRAIAQRTNRRPRPR